SQLITNHLAETSRHDDGPPFAPTSNLAVRAEVFDQLAFDETYPLAAGEDREWCERLARAGHDLVFEPDAWVAHHQELSARRFWRQQERYGRGAHRLRAGHGGDLRPARFYLGLLRAGFAAGPRTGSLVVVAQLATGVGVIREIAAGRRRNRSAERRYGSSRG
ncbi:MAG: glycosyltransferase family 2 protein, partial [Acidimicrobiales bacterium]